LSCALSLSPGRRISSPTPLLWLNGSVLLSLVTLALWPARSSLLVALCLRSCGPCPLVASSRSSLACCCPWVMLWFLSLLLCGLQLQWLCCASQHRACLWQSWRSSAKPHPTARLGHVSGGYWGRGILQRRRSQERKAENGRGSRGKESQETKTGQGRGSRGKKKPGHEPGEHKARENLQRTHPI